MRIRILVQKVKVVQSAARLGRVQLSRVAERSGRAASALQVHSWDGDVARQRVHWAMTLCWQKDSERDLFAPVCVHVLDGGLQSIFDDLAQRRSLFAPLRRAPYPALPCPIATRPFSLIKSGGILKTSHPPSHPLPHLHPHRIASPSRRIASGPVCWPRGKVAPRRWARWTVGSTDARNRGDHQSCSSAATHAGTSFAVSHK
jgi:hypothetical protein